MLAQADALTIHVPYTPATHRLVDARMLAKLKPGAVVVNTARGQVVDEDALLAALHSGHVRPSPPSSPPRALT